ncbi:MAG: hypothetical protein LBQ30_09415 [Treponema sp.]|jgi:hypothetical protein|nr:hypothetical protein [Treponema sp.]
MNKKIYANKTEQGDIRLTPGEFIGKTGPSGLPITSVTLSRMGSTFLWFSDFLNGSESGPVEHPAGDKTYQAIRNSDAVFLQEIRGNRMASCVGFSQAEIPSVLAQFQSAMAKAMQE